MSVSSHSFRVALIQMRCSIDPAENLSRACAMLRNAASEGGADGLPARTFPDAVFLPGGSDGAV